MEDKNYSIDIESLIEKKLVSVSNLLERCNDLKSIVHGLSLIKFSIESIKGGFDDKNESYIKFKKAFYNLEIINLLELREFYNLLRDEFSSFTYNDDRITKLIEISEKSSKIEYEVVDIMNSMRVNNIENSKESINKIIELLKSTDIKLLGDRYSKLLEIANMTSKSPDSFIINSDMLFPGLIDSYIDESKDSEFGKFISSNEEAFNALNNLSEDVKSRLGIKYQEGKKPLIRVEWV